MPESPNIGLKLTPRTNTGKKFIDWRTEMSGLEEDSNLMKIDGEIKNIHDSIDEHERDKADKAEPSTAGNLAGLDAAGNPVDSGKKPADFADATHKHGANDITAGTLGVPRGGTGAATFPQGNFLRGNGTGAFSSIAATDIPPIIGRGHATCTTAAGTAIKVAASTGFERSASAVVGVKFSYANTVANPSLNVNDTGNAAIYNALTDEPPVEGEMVAGTHFFMFNGSQWVLLNPYSRGGSTAELHTYIFPNHMVTAVKGTTVVTAAPATPTPPGLWAVLQLPELGVWEITMHLPGFTDGVKKTILIDTYGLFYLNFLTTSNTSWSNIIDFARMGIARKMLPLGFTKAVSMGGTNRDAQIIGFDHDNLPGGGKAPITFRATNSTTSVDFSGAQLWEDSNARTVLNSTVYNAFPPDVKAAIVPVLKRSGRSSGNPSVTTDYVFLPSEREVSGGYAMAHADEGFQYEYYAQGNTPTIGSWHWLRSLSRARAGYFVTMETNGTPGERSGSSGNSAYHAFCIG